MMSMRYWEAVRLPVFTSKWLTRRATGVPCVPRPGRLGRSTAGTSEDGVPSAPAMASPWKPCCRACASGDGPPARGGTWGTFDGPPVGRAEQDARRTRRAETSQAARDASWWRYDDRRGARTLRERRLRKLENCTPRGAVRGGAACRRRRRGQVLGRWGLDWPRRARRCGLRPGRSTRGRRTCGREGRKFRLLLLLLLSLPGRRRLARQRPLRWRGLLLLLPLLFLLSWWRPGASWAATAARAPSRAHSAVVMHCRLGVRFPGGWSERTHPLHNRGSDEASHL